MRNAVFADIFGENVLFADEETFLLFSANLPTQNLGFVDSRTRTLELCIAGVDLNIHQSPAVLASSRALGTTGAVVWKVTPLFADWIASANNVLIEHGILDQNTVVLELGCGVSGINALILAPLVAKYIATDQEYVLKLCQQNVDENVEAAFRNHRSDGPTTKRQPSKPKKARSTAPRHNIELQSLDWELHNLRKLGDVFGESRRVVVACDCIYNDALIEPFVNACVSASYGAPETSHGEPLCAIIIAQQLRSSEVFESWLAKMLQRFFVWRVPDAHLSRNLSHGSGFAVHVAVLRGQDDDNFELTRY